MTTLSVIIITKNEAHDIEDCLTSIQWADEIIILDSGSTDDTVQICQKYTDKIKVTDWQGFGIQKNRALEMATCDWILSIDADERVTKELKQEIQSAIRNPKEAIAFSLPRRSTFCGKIIRFGDWGKDRVTRIFKRDHAKFCNSIVHESLQAQGITHNLHNHLIHHTYKDYAEAIEKMEAYSTLGAQQRNVAGKKTHFGAAITHGFWSFLRGYFLRLGFLDGIAGLQLAVINAKGSYYRYVKLAQLNKSTL